MSVPTGPNAPQPAPQPTGNQAPAAHASAAPAPDPVDFNVHLHNAATGEPLTNTRAVITLAPGLSGTVRNADGAGFANFYHGPAISWAGDVTVIADGYAPYTTGGLFVSFNGSTVDLRIDLTPSFKQRFTPAPRVWAANMCGIRVPGLPNVPGGAADASLFISWFYDRYDPVTRATIRAAMKARGYTHWLLSWPDSRAYGTTPAQFRQLCQELIRDGFYPCVMLASKNYDPWNDPDTIIAGWQEILPLLVGLVPMFCVGWELSLWLTPANVQQLIDVLCDHVFTDHNGSRTLLYVHFQEGYAHFAQNGGFFADFWKLNVGKLTGVLHQKKLAQDRGAYQFDSGGLEDILVRFAGGANCPADSGFGHPFDLVALEITATFQFNGQMSESEGDSWGVTAMQTPPVNGPFGPVGVMGSGNGGVSAG